MVGKREERISCRGGVMSRTRTGEIRPESSDQRTWPSYGSMEVNPSRRAYLVNSAMLYRFSFFIMLLR